MKEPVGSCSLLDDREESTAIDNSSGMFSTLNSNNIVMVSNSPPNSHRPQAPVDLVTVLDISGNIIFV